jgi:endonuclease YncB( thermonuclease family)
MGNKVVRVVDGDTVEVRKTFGSTKCVRLARIDCPELRPLKTVNDRDLHKKAGFIAKFALQHRCLKRRVSLHIVEANDGRGRVMADVICRSSSLSDWLLHHKLAKPWAPGQTARQPWTRAELQEVVDAGRTMFPFVDFDALATAAKPRTAKKNRKPY